MVKKESKKQAALLAKLIDKKVGMKFSLLEKKVNLLSKEMKKISPTKVQKIEKEFYTMKEFLEDFNVKKLEEDIFKEFNVINRKLSHSLEERKEQIEHPPKKKFSSREQQDIESLKSKTHWLEIEVDKLNLHEVMEKIDEIEARLDRFRIANPMIIE